MLNVELLVSARGSVYTVGVTRVDDHLVGATPHLHIRFLLGGEANVPQQLIKREVWYLIILSWHE
jgi:hypothetical protein